MEKTSTKALSFRIQSSGLRDFGMSGVGFRVKGLGCPHRCVPFSQAFKGLCVRVSWVGDFVA